jgi:NAD(P)-dependent dehydrogenase (short-subunit alcohol dehydrogenase family)
MEAAAMGRRMRALNGKVAIVTGGTSGIGEKIVEVFVEEGAQVVIAARRQAEGDALEKRLGARFVRTDVSSEADVKTMVDRAVEWFGRVDCLVNNAGIPAPITSVADMEVADIERVLAVNILGVMLATKHVARVMLTQGTGSIINIGSVAAHRGGLSGHIYTSSKGAVLAFTRSAAAELGEKGIRVNSISPGAIVTGIFGKLAGVEASKADRITDSSRDEPAHQSGGRFDVKRGRLFDGSARRRCEAITCRPSVGKLRLDVDRARLDTGALKPWPRSSCRCRLGTSTRPRRAYPGSC